MNSTSNDSISSIPTEKQNNVTINTLNQNNDELNILDDKKLDGLDEIALSFGRFRHTWEKMSDIQIIRDALINSNVSMALAFLRWRNRNQINQFDNKLIFYVSGSLEHANYTFNSFKKLCYPIIYQTICQGQVRYTFCLYFSIN